MSGDQNRDDELDFEDFILEDAPLGDLEDLFADTPPGRPAAKAGADARGQGNGAQDPAASAQPDEEDLLFTSHEPTETPSESFAGREQFSEVSPVRWAGHKMPPQDIGIPEQEEVQDPLTDLNEDFPIDSDQELEVVHDDTDLGSDLALEDLEVAASATEDATDEGDAATADDDWSLEEPEETVVLEDEEHSFELAEASHDDDFGAGAADGEDGEEGEGTLLADAPLQDDYEVEEGWEPIGAGETGEESSDAAAEAAPEENWDEDELVGVGAEGDSELYVDDTPPEIIGAAPRRRRFAAVLPVLAAAAVVLGAGAVVVLKPEWIGIDLEQRLVERVQVARPNIEVAIGEPMLPAPQVAVTDPQPMDPVAVDPLPTDPLPGDPQPGDPVAVDPRPTDPQPTDPVAVDPQPTDPPVDPTTHIQLPAELPLPNNLQLPVPVAVAPGVPQAVEPKVGAAEKPKLLPAGETMWIGDFTDDAARRQALEGVSPGAKAFAQLTNGNFFVGSVKTVAEDALVMKLERGEVSLAFAEIVRVTAIDSSEYAELQKATAGFLRLSNNNRLSGQILSSIDDDAFVLQMRSDRIVVPKSAVSRIVAAEDDAVRFAQGEDEEQWLREFAVRQLRSQADQAAAPAPGGEGRTRSPNRPAAVPRK